MSGADGMEDAEQNEIEYVRNIIEKITDEKKIEELIEYLRILIGDH